VVTVLGIMVSTILVFFEVFKFSWHSVSGEESLELVVRRSLGQRLGA